jgi:hypothetical protein
VASCPSPAVCSQAEKVLESLLRTGEPDIFPVPLSTTINRVKVDVKSGNLYL